jgi:hypothetical protein
MFTWNNKKKKKKHTMTTTKKVSFNTGIFEIERCRAFSRTLLTFVTDLFEMLRQEAKKSLSKNGFNECFSSVLQESIENWTLETSRREAEKVRKKSNRIDNWYKYTVMQYAEQIYGEEDAELRIPPFHEFLKNFYLKMSFTSRVVSGKFFDGADDSKNLAFVQECIRSAFDSLLVQYLSINPRRDNIQDKKHKFPEKNHIENLKEKIQTRNPNNSDESSDEGNASDKSEEETTSRKSFVPSPVSQSGSRINDSHSKIGNPEGNHRGFLSCRRRNYPLLNRGAMETLESMRPLGNTSFRDKPGSSLIPTEPMQNSDGVVLVAPEDGSGGDCQTSPMNVPIGQ